MPPRKPIPVKRERTAKEYRAEALKRLKQRFEKENEGEEFDASGEVTITPLLKAAEGGIPRVLEALRAHDDDDARDFIGLYDSLSQKDRQYLKLEEIAVAAGIDALRLGEIAQTATFLHSQARTKFLLSAGMPGVVAQMMKQAVKPKGFVDREWALKSGGVLPTPKGSTIAIQTNVTTEKSESEEKTIPAYLDAGQRLRQIHEAVEQRQLPSPPRDPLPVGGHIDHLQQESAELLRGD